MWRVDKVATGLAIKQKCSEVGYGPKELSEYFKVTLTIPYLWFNGEIMPKLDNLVTLCKLCNCKVDDLLVVEEDL